MNRVEHPRPGGLPGPISFAARMSGIGYFSPSPAVDRDDRIAPKSGPATDGREGSGLTAAGNLRTAAPRMAENIRRALAGEPLIDLVDVSVGY